MKFDHLSVVDDYVHLRARKSRGRLTIPLSDITDNSPVASIKLSRDGRTIAWMDMDGKSHSQVVANLLNDEQEELRLLPTTMMRIGDIDGVHPLIEEALLKAGVDELFSKSPRHITEEALLKSLLIHPLIVHKHNKQYHCLGNIVAYKAASTFLKPELELPVQIHTAKKISSSTLNLIRNELLVISALQCSAPSEDTLFKCHEYLVEKEGLSSPFSLRTSSKSAFAKWKGCDLRRIK